MKALLLAAGRGTRLAALTDSVPKILTRLGGRPLLERQVAYLRRSGVTELAVNVHHHADQVREELDRLGDGLTLRVSIEAELRGTAGALLPLSDFLDESFLVLYGDVVTDADLGALMEHHRRQRGIATIAHYRSAETAAKGLLTLAEDGRVLGFVEKPEAHSGPAFVNAGLYALEPEVIEFVPRPVADFGLDVWPRLLGAGPAVFGFPLDCYLRDIGSPDALAAAERDLEEGLIRW